MATTKRLGDTAELAIAADLSARGHRILFPFGEDFDYDLVIERGSKLERIQCKYARSDGRVLNVPCASQSLTNGAVRKTKRYTAEMIEWLAVFDGRTSRCYYVPASELGSGMRLLTLRLVPTANNQVKGIRLARHYEDLPACEVQGPHPG